MADTFNNKVVLATGEVLIDLTQDDVKPEYVQKDIWFHDKSGERKQGTSTKTVDASSATATADEVIAGQTFGKGSDIVTGTMPKRSTNVEVSTLNGASIQRGYYDGSTKAVLSSTEAAKIISQNIKKGVNILGVDGSFGAENMAAQAITVDPTFTDQLVQPDKDHDFLTEVTVKAIKVTKTDNEYGGKTVTIG